MKNKLHVLIIDDDQDMAQTLSDILSLSGHESVVAFSGAQGLEKSREQRFDCVLTDVRMPGMDGVEFHRQLIQSLPGLPVVLMTAFAADEVVRQGLDEGVVGVVDKPLDIRHLLGFFGSLSRNRAIAIVDDDAAFCKTLAVILQKRGFRVGQFSDIPDDVELVASDSQVVLLNLKLKGMSSLDALKSIRSRYPTLPVLLVAGYGPDVAPAIQAALEIGAYTCLYKPLEIPNLLEKLSQLQLERLRGALDQ